MSDLPGGAESILLVEDEEAVRTFACAVLTDCGYRVRAAAVSAEALAVVAGETDTFHLLLADIALPGEGGRSLAEKVERLRPGIRVLFTSGYPDELVRAGPQGGELNFLPKPFTPLALARAVRSVLDAPGPGARA
jgi:two-component system, cell cycle sensor histidine kinase and response regulator CckA